MARKTIETISHNYDPVNKYIDDQARLKRSASSWRYAKSTALILVAVGILVVLLALAYHIFKKPHEINYSKNEIVKSQVEEKDINNDIINKNDEIQEKESELKNSPENEKLKEELEDLKKEKAELEKKLDDVAYTESVSVFKRKEINGNLTVVTGFGWEKLDNLRSGKKHDDDWCYIESNTTTAKYYFGVQTDQSALLRELGITENEALSYKKNCKN